MGPFCGKFSHLFQRIELILTHWIALDTIVRIILSSRRDSHRSAHGSVAAESTSRDKKMYNSITFSDPYQKCLRKPWKFLSFFLSQAPLLQNCCRTSIYRVERAHFALHLGLAYVRICTNMYEYVHMYVPAFFLLARNEKREQ